MGEEEGWRGQEGAPSVYGPADARWVQAGSVGPDTPTGTPKARRGEGWGWEGRKGKGGGEGGEGVRQGGRLSRMGSLRREE